jgi:hypothetical protein
MKTKLIKSSVFLFALVLVISAVFTANAAADEEKMYFYTRNARSHAKITHDREANYRRMTEIYEKIIREKST